ncbi:MAG: tetratricopeptide repeat protein, partial [Planctomycetota bacterium]
ERVDPVDRPTLVRAGEPGPAPSILGWLRTRPEARRRHALVDICTRLDEANAAGEWSSLTAGLLRHYEGQLRNPPWKTIAQNTELVTEALVHLQEAALRAEPDHFTRQVWNGLARILVGKRDVPGIYRWIEPVAGAWSPWIPGELALAHAEVESLEPAEAIARLAPLADERPQDASLAEGLARALDAAGVHASAAERWSVVLAQRPSDRRVLRALAVSLLDAGMSPEARAVLEQLSLAHPDDLRLPELLRRLEEAARGDE